MGRVKLCIIMLIIIMMFCGFGLFFISRETAELTTLLDRTEKLCEAGDTTGALKAAKQLGDLWENYQDIASIFVRNDKISGAQASMTRLFPLIESHSEELSAEISNARSCLEWIIESEIPKIYNIL